MARAKTEKEKGNAAAARKTERPEEAREKQKPGDGRSQTMLIALALSLAILFALFYFLVLPALSVPFSTFKKNFQAAQRVAVVASYKDQSGSGATLQCAAQSIQVIAHTRNATTIDYYVLNQTSCLQSVGGLGHVFTPVSNTIGNCLNASRAETGLYLNYSGANGTVITPYKLHVYGNLAYMTSCPIAVDLS